MYLRIINNQPVWPYTLNLLRRDESSISFPDVLTPEILNEYQIFEVLIDSKPEIAYDQDAVLSDPVLENDQWVQHWTVQPAAAADAQSRFDQQCVLVRDERNRKLAECDWTQLGDVPSEVSVAWQGYRQQLRDLTDQSGFPFNIEWPPTPV